MTNVISDKADKLIDKYGLTQHRWTPDAWEHRQNLRTHIADLEAEVAELKAKLESVLENNLKFRSVCYHLLSDGEKLKDVLVAWKALEDSKDGGKEAKEWYQKHKDVLENEACDGNK